MALDIRLLLATQGCRRRITAGMQPSEAATRCAHMLDVDAEQILRLALTAESACTIERLVLRHQPEPAS